MTQAMAASPAHFSPTCSQLKESAMYLVTSAPHSLFLATLSSRKVLSKTLPSFSETPQSHLSTPHTYLSYCSLCSPITTLSLPPAHEAFSQS